MLLYFHPLSPTNQIHILCDIFLGDKGFCSFYDAWQFQQRQVDQVITLARRTPVEAADAVQVLGPDDLLIQWPRPVWHKNLGYSKAQWQAMLPQSLSLRQVKITVAEPGFVPGRFTWSAP